MDKIRCSITPNYPVMTMTPKRAGGESVKAQWTHFVLDIKEQEICKCLCKRNHMFGNNEATNWCNQHSPKQ